MQSTWTRARSAAETGHRLQLGGIQRIVMDDGPERGGRFAAVNTVEGLEVGIALDLGMDIAWCRYRGRSLAWHSAAGFGSPALREQGDYGWERSWGGGLMTTGGLDHVFAPAVDDSDDRRGRGPKRYPHHGSIAGIPARIVRCEDTWDGDEPVSIVEGLVRQATPFAETLELRREIVVTPTSIAVHDTVTNIGGRRNPHAILYHINAGAPLLTPGSVVDTGRIIRTFPQDQHISRVAVAPRQIDDGTASACEPASTSGTAFVGVTAADGQWGLKISYGTSSLPFFTRWDHLGVGDYLVALEPSSVPAALRRDWGSLSVAPWLEPGEARHYTVRFDVWDRAGDGPRGPDWGCAERSTM